MLDSIEEQVNEEINDELAKTERNLKFLNISEMFQKFFENFENFK